MFGSRTWSIAAVRRAIFLPSGEFAYPNGRENVQNSRYGVFQRLVPQRSHVGRYAAVCKRARVGPTEQPESSARCFLGDYAEAIAAVLLFHSDHVSEAAEHREIRIEFNAENRPGRQQSIPYGAVGGSGEGRFTTRLSAVD